MPKTLIINLFLLAEIVYGYAAAAEHLGCTQRYLRRNIKKLPHRKLGNSIVFTDDHLAAIAAAAEVRPPEFTVDRFAPSARRRRTS